LSLVLQFKQVRLNAYLQPRYLTKSFLPTAPLQPGHHLQR